MSTDLRIRSNQSTQPRAEINYAAAAGSSDERVVALAKKQLKEEEKEPSPYLKKELTPTQLSLLPLAQRASSPPSKSKDVAELFCEVFGVRGNLPEKIKEAVIDYLNEDEREIYKSFLSLFTPNKINLSDRNVLISYLGENFQNKNQYLDIARAFAARIYETSPREAEWVSFPMNPEILAFAMRLAKNNIVLEIAGSTGENAILLALAGAKKVYVNDIENSAIRIFRRFMETLPPKLRERLESLPGDCFSLLEQKPGIANQVDLVLCRNLIHFFNDKQQDDFFRLLTKTLKPGGRAILTVNSTEYSRAEVFKRNPNDNSFSITDCVLIDNQNGGAFFSSFPIFQEVSVYPGHLVSDKTEFYTLYTRKLGSKWEVNNDQFCKLDERLRPKIKEAVRYYQKTKIAPLKAGRVEVVKRSTRHYSKRNLEILFNRHGFIVELTFVVARDGHLVHVPANDRNFFGEGMQTGIIVRKPLNAQPIPD